MPFVRFPSKFVFWTQIPDDVHQKIKSELVPKIQETYEKHKDNKPFVLGNATTSYSPQYKTTLEDNEFLMDDYYQDNIIWKPFQKMIDENNKSKEIFPISISKSIVSSGWYTAYNENDSFGPHGHYDKTITIDAESEDMFHSSFSFIYILNDENENNSTVFMVDDISCVYHWKEHLEFHTSDHKDIKEGTVIIFPSNLLHYVKSNKVAGRITLAYNISSSFE